MTTTADQASPTPYCVVYVSCASVAEGKQLANALVRMHVAACISILPAVTSVFYWENTLQIAEECLLMIKTHTSQLPALKQQVQALHTYQVPELIALPMMDGSDAYFNWMNSVLAQSNEI